MGARLAVHRAEEPLLACVVPELSACPVVLDQRASSRTSREALEEQLRQHGRVVVAKDGSAVDGVAAWSVVWHDAPSKVQ